MGKTKNVPDTDEGINTMSFQPNPFAESTSFQPTPLAESTILQTQDSGLGTSKKRRNSVDFVMPSQQNQIKKRKTIHRNSSDDFFDRLVKLQQKNKFCDFEKIDNTVKFVINSNEGVTALVEIWKASELFVLITFADRKEAVIVDDTTFGKFKTQEKIQRLQNFVANMKRVKGGKEELIPSCSNWNKYIEGKRPKMEPVNDVAELIRDENMENVAAINNNGFNPQPDTLTSMIPIGFPILDENQQNRIDQWSRAADGELIISQFGRLIYGRDIHCLRTVPPGANSMDYWLNDQVINQYLNLLSDHSANVQSIDSHFWPGFLSHGYYNVETFTRRFKLFECDSVLMPIHQNGNHWCLASIHPTKRQIRLYNSLTDNSDRHVLEQLKDFVRSECQHRLGHTLDTAYWTTYSVENIPQQSNGLDCGVFLCVFAQFAINHDFIFNFSQCHIEYFRKKILFEICTGQLLN